MDPRFLLFLLLLTIVIACASSSSNDEDQCVYTVYVRTGSIMKGGTDARIGLSLGDADSGRVVDVPDLESWGGLMGPGHDYFERGGLDAFSGRGPCWPTGGPLCSLNLTSDGAGAHHGWFCDYVEVTSTGPHVPCSQTLFYVGQWLASDAPPYQLYASLDGCDALAAGGRLSSSRFVVGGDDESESTSSSSSAAFSA